MKISYKGDYAIKALLYISARYKESGNKEEYVQLAEISQSQDIPVKFLEQILLILKNAGYVKSLRGKKGGYSINREPDEVRLGEIIQLIDGPISPIACVSKSGYKYCDFEDKFQYKCVLKGIWAEARDAVSGIVNNITFDDLVEREKKLHIEKAGAYSYDI